MNNGRIKFILLWIFLIVSFSVFAAILVLEAYGYRVNRETWTLQPTGVIVLDGQPRRVEILLNGQLSSDQDLPVKLSKLLPGQYDITLNKTDYQTWSKTFTLAGGQAIEDKHIQLFLNEPKVAESARKTTLKELQNDFKNQAGDLVLKDNEIWLNEKLVTRFSQKPLGAVLINYRSQIIFQSGNELRAMDIDGTNNIKLITLPNDTAVAFALYGDKLVYASGDKFWEAEIK